MSDNRDHLLGSYLVTFLNGQQYRFQAESEGHAYDQAKDAEPTEDVLGIARECWLWTSGWAGSSTEDGGPTIAGYMASQREQAQECRILRLASEGCSVHFT